MIIDELICDDLIVMILCVKKCVDLLWVVLVELIGMLLVWLYLVVIGMNVFFEDKVCSFVSIFGLFDSVVVFLIESLLKVWEQVVLIDFCLYWFYEIVGVYGLMIKVLINEEFGNGIMLVIDFLMYLECEKNFKGDCVKLIMFGKYLVYLNW